MSDEKIRYAYRICPCFSYDVEGIQTWLEDLAAEGLVLEADGIFLGFFTFRKTIAQKCVYRLVPIKQKRGFFDDSDAPDQEEQEFSQHCGWEYLVRYGSFYIYRATGPGARPLHTDPTVHAMALEGLKKEQRSLIISRFLLIFIYSFFSRHTVSFFRTGAVIGLLYLLSVIAFGLWLVGSSVIHVLRLSKYQKRLRNGEHLDASRPWKQRALFTRCVKLLPWVIGLVFVLSWGSRLVDVQNRLDLEDFREEPPFAVISDVFPEASPDRGAAMGDYNTVIHYATGLSDNYEWNEQAYVTDDRGSYHCILRLEYHETVSEFWAKGLADDYYRGERLRYHGERFQDLAAPETAFDDVRVFSSYGILHILIRHDTIVAHAVVSVSQAGQNNHWQLWLEAMEQKLLG